jgi:hypothetical protein
MPVAVEVAVMALVMAVMEATEAAGREAAVELIMKEPQEVLTLVVAGEVALTLQEHLVVLVL